MPAWRDAWRRWRNRRLADPLFRQRAMGFALTRPLARHNAARLFDLVAGFVYSQVLMACVRLDLFERLHAHPASAEELARALGYEAAAMQRLLRAAAAIGLLEEDGEGRYGLGPMGAPMVGNTAVADMVRHHTAFYADLADPLALLRRGGGTGQVARHWPYAGHEAPQGLDEAVVAPYSALMSASQPLVAQLLLDSHPFERGRRLLDVGGGEGAFVMAAAARAPALELHLFDLPAVAGRAARAFGEAGLAARAHAHGGDFLADPLPAGMDIVTLVRVLHDHDDAPVQHLLRRVHEALLPGGVVLIAEPMADTAGARGMADAYLGLYLWAMGQGEARSATRLGRMLREAGFDEVQERPSDLPMQARVLRARKPQFTVRDAGVILN